MSFDKLLNKLCSIQSKVEVQNETGSVDLSWSDIYVNIPCRYNRTKIGTVIAGSYQVTIQDYTFYFKKEIVLSEGYRITLEGKVFEIQHAYKNSSGHHWEVFARLISFE